MAEQIAMCGDCVEGMGGLAEDSVDVVVTSPPYNLGKQYSGYDDSLLVSTYIEWMGGIAEEICRVLKPDGSLFLNVGWSCKYPTLSLDVLQAFLAHFRLQNRIAWVKSLTVEDRTYGHFKPINSPRFLNNNWEDLFHLTLTANTPLDRLAVGVPYEDKTNIGRWDSVGCDLRCGGNVWFIPYETITSRDTERGGHPATFPVELAVRCIRLHGVTDKTLVLDPFVGTGTTLVACKQVGVDGVGFDISQDYVDYANTRVAKSPDCLPAVDTNSRTW